MCCCAATRCGRWTPTPWRSSWPRRSTPDGTYGIEAGDGQRLGAVRGPDAAPGHGGCPAPRRVVRRALDRHLATAHGIPRRYRDVLQQRRLDALRGDPQPARGRRRWQLPAAVDGVDPVRFLESSIARWLTGSPGYGSGNTSRGDFVIEDEYLMLGADALYGLGPTAGPVTDRAWFEANESRITRAIAAMRRRDLDGDGLIESRHPAGRQRRAPVEHDVGGCRIDGLEGRLVERGPVRRAPSPRGRIPSFRQGDGGGRPGRLGRPAACQLSGHIPHRGNRVAHCVAVARWHAPRLLPSDAHRGCRRQWAA